MLLATPANRGSLRPILDIFGRGSQFKTVIIIENKYLLTNIAEN